MDQLYTDLVTKVLPKIGEGLTITKEYFVDLTSRYVQYLIITDTIYLCISVIGFVVSSLLVPYLWKKHTKDAEYLEDNGLGFLSVILAVVAIAFVVAIGVNSLNLVKDYNIPELRIYETVKGINSPSY